MSQDHTSSSVARYQWVKTVGNLGNLPHLSELSSIQLHSHPGSTLSRCSDSVFSHCPNLIWRQAWEL